MHKKLSYIHKDTFDISDTQHYERPLANIPNTYFLDLYPYPKMSQFLPDALLNISESAYRNLMQFPLNAKVSQPERKTPEYDMLVDDCKYHPQKNKSYYLKKIRSSPYILYDIPPEIIDTEICFEALFQYPHYRKIFKIILAIKGLDLIHPEEIKDKSEITLKKKPIKEKDFINFLEHSCINSQDFNRIPDKYKTHRVCVKAIELNPRLLPHIPKHIQTESFYLDLFSGKYIEWSEIPECFQKKIKPISHTLPLLSRTDTPFKFEGTFHHVKELSEEMSKRGLQLSSPYYHELLKLQSSPSPQATSFPRIDNHNLSLIKTGAVFGGRTLKVGRKHYKFMHQKETIKSFVLESETALFLLKNKAELGLRSEIPIPTTPSITKVPISPETAFISKILTDAPKTFTNSSTHETSPFFLVYCYEASDDYATYAYIKDTESDDPYQKSHQGLFKGIHDVARLAKHGMLYTSVLPAYHYQSAQRWITIGMEAPGSMEGWSTSATDFPDYGYSGLRDFGDFSLLGTTTVYLPSLLRYGGACSWVFSQKNALYNTLSENILATLLLFARLHRNDPQYHHKNKAMLESLQIFFKKILFHTLSGYFDNSPPSIYTHMKISEEIYNNWIKISMERFIYWTETQNIEKDCYTRDILTYKKLNETIYPNLPDGVHALYEIHPEKGFVDEKGQPQLGMRHHISVLMNLIEGIALFCRGIEQKAMPIYVN